MQQREKLGSRIGFILLSAGCAIGLGNVWKFPYITAAYGGAAFILIYALFLLGKTMQAFVFFMLTMFYIKGAIEAPEH